MEMIKLTIDNREVEVEKGSTILDAARKLGIEVPTLCHLNLPHLTHADQPGSCRICVMEVQGARNLLPSCATKAMPNMVIQSRSSRVVEARKTILDLMMSNHPEDCLTCEKAGDCSLQNYCYEYGVEKSSFKGARSEFPIDDSNDFYTRDMNKCILCRRCVTACSNLQVQHVLGFAKRGIETHVASAFDGEIKDSNCVSCGNCVSVCPTGALQPKSKVKFRKWETRKVATTCSYCGVGCQMDLVVKGNQIVDVEPRVGEANSGLLCVKGKFAYKFVNHPDRLTTPLIRKNGKLEAASWDEAYDLITAKYNEIKTKHGSSAFAGLTSARATNEDNYLFQKMVRTAFGTNNIDHCARL